MFANALFAHLRMELIVISARGLAVTMTGLEGQYSAAQLHS